MCFIHSDSSSAAERTGLTGRNSHGVGSGACNSLGVSVLGLGHCPALTGFSDRLLFPSYPGWSLSLAQESQLPGYFKAQGLMVSPPFLKS